MNILRPSRLKKLKGKSSNDVNKKRAAHNIKLGYLFMIILIRPIMPFKGGEKVDYDIDCEESIHEVFHDQEKDVASLGDKSCPVW